MAKHYGSNVGAVKQIVPFRPVDAAYEGSADTTIIRDTCNLAAAPAADTIVLGVMGWETVLDCWGSMFINDAMGAGVTVAVGDVTFPSALLGAHAVNVAGQGGLFASVTPAKFVMPLWQMLGYADLPTAKKVGQQCELLGTIAGGAATGNLAWMIRGARRI